MSGDFAVRAACEGDLDWLLSTWRDSYRGAGEVQGMPWPLYREAIRRRSERLLRAVGGVVACDPEDVTNLVGWACGDAKLLHYVYVRHQPSFRGMGVARALVAALGSPSIFTHRSPALRGTPPGLTFHPISLLPERNQETAP